MHEIFIILQLTVGGLNTQLPGTLGPNGGLKVECLGGTCSGGGGGGGGLTDTDDDNVAGGQIPSLFIGLNYLWNGTNWARWTGSVAQSGTWNIGTLTSITNSVAVTGTFWQATQPVSGPLTDGQLRATPVPVSGTFWQATQPVSGTFWQATQPVSGTFWQATQPISGTVAATQSGVWTVQPGNTANTTPWVVTEDRSSTSVLTNVADVATNTTCLVSNANRRKAILRNDSTVGAYIKYGATASSTSHSYRLEAGQTAVEDDWTGIIDCIWDSDAAGSMRVTEITN